MISTSTFQFLIDLKFNNNRNWFHENKARYQKAKEEFELLVDQLIPLIKQFDKAVDVDSHKECMFRIYRDVRFSKNKEPYKPNFGAFIAKGGRKSPYAGYYIHCEPDNSFIGGGIYMPPSPILKSIRTSIVENTNNYKKIIQEKAFKNEFSEIYGEKLKGAPRGFSKDFKDIELLKNKHFVVSKKIANEFWFTNNLAQNITDTFKLQVKFNTFLNKAVAKV